MFSGGRSPTCGEKETSSGEDEEEEEEEGLGFFEPVDSDDSETEGGAPTRQPVPPGEADSDGDQRAFGGSSLCSRVW